MSKDLHDIDELFRSALDSHEEAPSRGVKENIDAVLDRKDGEKYKKRFIFWKRTALFLLLLLAGIVLYDSGLIKRGRNYYTAKTTNSGTDKTEIIYPDKNTEAGTPVNTIATNQPAIQTDTAAEHQKQNDIITTPGAVFIVKTSAAAAKNKQPGKQVSLLTQIQDPLVSIITPKQAKKANDPTDYRTSFQTGEPGIEALDKRISIASQAERLTKKVPLLPPFFAYHSPPKHSPENNAGKKKSNLFNPYWTLTPFVSYDQAGYKLDSDEPSAITSIKFREANEPSFSAGLLLGRQVAPRFSLQSGIVYRNTAIGMKPQKTYAFVDPTGDVAYKYITSSGYAFIKPGFGPQPIVGDSLTTSEAKHTLENISVPLMAKYTVLNKKVSITPGAGIEADFITKANLEVDIEDTFNREIVVVKKLNGTKSFYWSFIAEAEIKYTLNKKIALSLRPVYRQALSPITKNNVVETFPRSFGIGAGVTIKF